MGTSNGLNAPSHSSTECTSRRVGIDRIAETLFIDHFPSILTRHPHWPGTGDTFHDGVDGTAGEVIDVAHSRVNICLRKYRVYVGRVRNGGCRTVCGRET